MSFDKKFGKDFLERVPSMPGVYFFWDLSRKVIYIGKAKNLRRRLSQYKNAKRLKKHAKMRLLIKEASEISWVECLSAGEAARNEISLIQQYRPVRNIASKFSFMYPFVAMRLSNAKLELLLTTQESELKGFKVFGVFRSRRLTRDAYFSLHKLLQYLFRTKKIRTSESYTYKIESEKVDEEFVVLLERYLKGEDSSFLGELVIRLVEKSKARVRSELVQEAINKLKRFYIRETRRLQRVKEKSGFIGEFVSQEERDILFLKEPL